MLDDDQAQRARQLRDQAHGPADIARRLDVPVDEVRAFLESEGLDGARPVLTPEPLAGRVAVAVDLLTPAEARDHLGISADTLRRWVDERALPYRDAPGRVTSDAYNGRWCMFSRAELDRWIGGRAIPPVVERGAAGG